VVHKRLRNVCGLPEDEGRWKIGRGFVTRNLPWTADKLRAITPFEFENWAVIQLGAIANKLSQTTSNSSSTISPATNTAPSTTSSRTTRTTTAESGAGSAR
jgi:hypothetical protein